MIGYYNQQKLKLNQTKTNLLVVSKPKLKDAAKEVEFEVENDGQKETIKPVSQMKLLGWEINTRMSMDSYAIRLYSELCHKINVFNKISRFTSEDTRVRFANTFLKSKFNYGLPLLFSESEKVKQIMHRSIMKIGRYVKNSYC